MRDAGTVAQSWVLQNGGTCPPRTHSFPTKRLWELHPGESWGHRDALVTPSHKEVAGYCLHGEGALLRHVEPTRTQKRLLMITSMESAPTDVSLPKQSTPGTCPPPLGLWDICSLSCQPLTAPCPPDFLFILCLETSAVHRQHRISFRDLVGQQL